MMHVLLNFFILVSLVLSYLVKGFIYKPSLLRYYNKDTLATTTTSTKSRISSFVHYHGYAASRVRIAVKEGNNFFDGDDLQQQSSHYYHMSFNDETDELRYRIARRKVLGTLVLLRFPSLGNSPTVFSAILHPKQHEIFS
jgi:hypothetical protein